MPMHDAAVPAVPTVPRARRRSGRAPAGPGLARRHPELVLFLAAYLVYVGARWIFVSDLGTARLNAGRILDLEDWSGTRVERGVQEVFDSAAWSTVWSNVYLAAQMVVLPASLVVLHRFARPVYRGLRNTVIATWAISIPIFAMFPVAPPRLAGVGLVDMVSGNGAASLSGSSTIFYNPYAAVPSLHVGFAFAIAIAVAAAVRHPVWKVMAMLWGPIVALAVVVTGNHYVFDVMAGLAVTVVGWAIGLRIRRA